MIATAAPGTPLGEPTDAQGNPAPPFQYEIEGTLAGRTGASLARAIEAELGFGANTVTVSGTNVVVGGQTMFTLADGDLDKPTNNGVARYLRDLLGRFRGDTRTIVWQALKCIARWVRYKAGWTLTKAQFQALAGKAYDAVTTSDADGA